MNINDLTPVQVEVILEALDDLREKAIDLLDDERPDEDRDWDMGDLAWDCESLLRKIIAQTGVRPYWIKGDEEWLQE